MMSPGANPEIDFGHGSDLEPHFEGLLRVRGRGHLVEKIQGKYTIHTRRFYTDENQVNYFGTNSTVKTDDVSKRDERKASSVSPRGSRQHH